MSLICSPCHRCSRVLMGGGCWVDCRGDLRLRASTVVRVWIGVRVRLKVGVIVNCATVILDLFR